MYCGTDGKTFAKLGGAVCGCCAVWLCIASACWGQGAQLPTTPPSHSHVPPARSAANVPSTNSSDAPKSLRRPRKKSSSPTDATAKLATVKLTNGNLTIQANNSDLGQILRDLAKMSGMTVNGLNQGPRVSGNYGPGKSREVLTDLLVASGYNFIMIGDIANGAPRELMLTGNGDNPASNSSHPALPAPDQGEKSDQPDVETNPAGPDPTAPDPSAPDATAPDPSAPDATAPDAPGVAAPDASAPDPSVTAPGAPEPVGPGAITPAPSLDSAPDNNKRAEQNQKSLQQEQPQQEAPQQEPPQ